jgi:hypothetical protein
MENIINFLTINNTNATRVSDINSILTKMSEIMTESINENIDNTDISEYDRLLIERIQHSIYDAFSINTQILSDAYLNFEFGGDINNDNTTYYDLEDVKIHLTQDEYNQFKKKHVTNRFIKKLNENICNVCLEPYKLKDCYVTLQCRHNFHDLCIQKWLLNESTKCPICRHSCK